MSRLIWLACVAALLLPLAERGGGRWSKYVRVEAYEIRPGVLILPKYSGDGELCEAVIEKEHYQDGVVDLDSTLPRKVVAGIFDQVAPPAKRGPFTIDKELEGLSLYGGGGVTTFVDYKNVSLDMSRATSDAGYIVAVIAWKRRGCPAGRGGG